MTYADEVQLTQTQAINLLGLMVTAVCFGFSMASLHRRKTRPFLITLDSFSEIALKLMRVTMW
jgi:Na+/H+-dicarboxylate symporter